MGIFSRLAQLIKSNLNDLISKSEDPEKMLQQVVLDMNNQLVEAKKQVASSIADEKKLAKQFEQHRGHLRSVAFRMLGSLPEAEDAVQDAWLNAARAGSDGVDNLGGWLTTIVARVCLDQLRSRKSRREESLDVTPLPTSAVDPEQEAAIADSVGLALLVVLERLEPAERLAFVLHDMFAMPFEDIAKILGKNEDAARQLASRGRRRVQGEPTLDAAQIGESRARVGTFLTALRTGDLESLVRILDPAIQVKADREVIPEELQRGIRGARGWAEQVLHFSRGAKLARIALVDGMPGIVVAPRGRLLLVLRFGWARDKVDSLEVIADPTRLAALTLAVFEN